MKSKCFLSALLFILCIGHFNYVHADSQIYPVSAIPKPLLKGAKAVVRNEDIVVTIKSNDKLTEKIKYVITVLNKNGDHDAEFRVDYDKNTRVSDIKAKMYDEVGLEIKKKGGFEVLDYAMISDYATYSDNRVKAINPEHLTYPYTMEYTYEVTYSGVLLYPDWYPISDYNLSVEKSRFTLNVSNGDICRFYEKNLTSKAQLTETSDGKVYSWLISQFPAIQDENFNPALTDFTPIVLLSPSEINVEGYKGNINTWAGFGNWINQLNQDRNNLKDETKAMVRKMTDGAKDEREKIKILYEYMQNKVRYVSITVGIGGFQPFDAATVDRLSYGDCKALSNYMKSLLDAAGISSRYTLVCAGRDKPSIISDFPSSQFNHAILCVPQPKDTVWLECTSQNKPFNYLGPFTADRQVLVVDEHGGKLIRTPKLTAESNLVSRKTNVTLDANGGGFADVKTVMHGTEYDSYRSILSSDQTDRKKLVTKSIHIPNFELDNFSIQEFKAETPSATEKLKLTVTDYCTKVGEKLMLCLNMMNKQSESPFPSADRKTPISFKWPVYEIDTVSYDLPQGYTLEKIPQKVSLQSDFGQYSTEVTKSGSTIRYIRTLKIFQADYPIEKYEDLVAFFEKIVTADENKVLLTRGM